MTASLTPARAAERTGVSIDTLRYYEREGLIGPIARTAGGHRTYTDDDVFAVGLITCLRDAGLGIADLRGFTTLLRDAHPPRDRVAFLTERKAELENKAAAIHAAIAVLTEKIDHYAGRVR